MPKGSKLQSGGHGQKHAIGTKKTPKTGAMARGATKHEHPPSSPTRLAGHSNKGSKSSTRASGGNYPPGHRRNQGGYGIR